jgi:hypothetical protein
MKLLVPMVCAGALVFSPPAFARSLKIQGVTGYLSEYELSADVSVLSDDGGIEKLSGPLNVKHVGLCTHAGPNEMQGRLEIHFVGPSDKIKATLSYDGRECTYDGFLTESVTGFMTCTNNLTLPLKLWTK